MSNKKLREFADQDAIDRAHEILDLLEKDGYPSTEWKQILLNALFFAMTRYCPEEEMKDTLTEGFKELEKLCHFMANFDPTTKK
jgi:hypothetical protein